MKPRTFLLCRHTRWWARKSLSTASHRRRRRRWCPTWRREWVTTSVTSSSRRMARRHKSLAPNGSSKMTEDSRSGWEFGVEQLTIEIEVAAAAHLKTLKVSYLTPNIKFNFVIFGRLTTRFLSSPKSKLPGELLHVFSLGSDQSMALCDVLIDINKWS